MAAADQATLAGEAAAKKARRGANRSEAKHLGGGEALGGGERVAWSIRRVFGSRGDVYISSFHFTKVFLSSSFEGTRLRYTR